MISKNVPTKSLLQIQIGAFAATVLFWVLASMFSSGTPDYFFPIGFAFFLLGSFALISRLILLALLENGASK